MTNFPEGPIQDELAELEQQLAGSVRGARFMDREPDAERVFQKFMSGEQRRTHGASLRRGYRSFRYLGIAAALVLTVVGIKYVPEIIVSRFPSPVSPKIYTTTTGQRATITLADGSIVTLAPATTMRVSGRTVDLNGEAVFTVTQHSGSPFVVKASGTETRVLGTTFGVRAYQSDKTVRVAVAEGKVMVGGPAKSNEAVLGMGDVAEAEFGRAPIMTRDADVLALLGWTRGRLAFKSVPLAKVIDDLERWYGLNIEIRDPRLAAEPVTAEFDNSSEETVMGALAEVLRARYERQGRKVTFSRIDFHD